MRAFRDVPFNVTSTDTNEGARDPMPQVSSQEILTYLINDLEGCKDDGMTDYGSKVFNACRITKDAIYTLLSDLYLWRACKNASPDSAAVYPGQSQADYAKVVEYCDYVLKDKLHKFQEEHEKYYGSRDATKMPLPLYESQTLGRITDTPYRELFGDKASLESIFEIAYDGTTNNNELVTYFFGGVKDGSVQVAYVGGSNITQTLDLKPDMGKNIYCQTDLRAVENLMYDGGSTSSTETFQVIKHIAEGVEVIDGTNVRKKAGNGSSANVSYQSVRSKDIMDANWIIYRVSDVILMKAEAMTCLAEDGAPELEEAFNLANAVLDRSNPMIETKNKLKYSAYGSASLVLDFIMRERQREFFAEGKRWFDLVRMALRDNSTQKMLNLLTAKYATNASAIKAKLATLNSLFSPVLKDEIKVNPALVQNPAWVVDETIERH